MMSTHFFPTLRSALGTQMLVLAALIVFAAASARLAPVQAEDLPDLSGPWAFDVLTSPNGPGKREVLFAQEGNRVIGFVESNSASGRFVGTFDGTNLHFTAVLEFGGQPLAADYYATVDGDTMEGRIEYGLYGTATFVGRRVVAKTSAGDGEIIGSAKEVEIEAARVGDAFGVLHGDTLAPEMLAVKGGTFIMGSALPDADKDYNMPHEVTVSDFRMSRFVVTNAQYAAFLEATGYDAPWEPKGWTAYMAKYPNHPVVNVSWYDAKAYTDWLSELTGETYRLPTEAEWEYAARAGHEGWRYVWGNEWDNQAANISTWRMGYVPDRDGWKKWWDAEGEKMSKSQPMTTRVGSFPPNDWGFYDLTGNVWEWTNDWYEQKYYLRSPAKDPMGPDSGDEKVLRGASWYNKPDVSWVSTRDRYAPDVKLNYNGFRVVAVGGNASE